MAPYYGRILLIKKQLGLISEFSAVTDLQFKHSK